MKVWSILLGFPLNICTHETDPQFIISTGIPIKSTLDNATSVLYAGLIGQLTEKARNVVREMVRFYEIHSI